MFHKRILELSKPQLNLYPQERDFFSKSEKGNKNIEYNYYINICNIYFLYFYFKFFSVRIYIDD